MAFDYISSDITFKLLNKLPDDVRIDNFFSDTKFIFTQKANLCYIVEKGSRNIN